MTDDEIGILQGQLAMLRRERDTTEFGVIPRSITYLRDCIAREIDDEPKKVLYSLLLGECSRAGMQAVTLCVLREQLNAFPDDPLSYTGMANAMAGEKLANDEVFSLLRRAVELASAQNSLLRYCLVSQARMALDLRSAPVFNEAIRQLILDAVNVRDQDIWLEFDFLDSIPAGFADEEQLDKYRSLQS